MEKIVNLCKSRGFVYQGSEIYGGLANSWDYGPLGSALKNNIKNLWLNKFVYSNKYNVSLDSSIIGNPKIWEASGHLSGFSDPLIDCRDCKSRFRADKLIEEYAFKNNLTLKSEGISEEEVIKTLYDNKICCPKCGKLNYTDIRKFNLMFKTFQGVVEDSLSTVYLRPETAQGIFVNFKNIQRTTRKKLPFGIGQVGKAFRNEITPGNFIFRTREFEQMELEFFCKPGEDLEWFKYWKDYCYNFLLNIGIKKENIRLRDHDKDELVFYSNATTDIEYKFPFGFGELWGIADRTDYDLKQHSNLSKEDLSYSDENEKYIPYCIEPSVGCDRLMFAILCDAYTEEKISDDDTRLVLKLHPALAPIKIGILPLSKKLSDGSNKLYDLLSKKYACEIDESGSIGKRYRRFDEIGTPYCITYDFESENDNAVTIRNRDTMIQERVNIDNLYNWFENKFEVIENEK